MRANRLTPILNVSDIQQSFQWFDRLGWEKAWDLGHAAVVWRRLLRRVRDFPLSERARWAGQE